MTHIHHPTTPTQKPASNSFETMGISSQILHTLNKMKITIPTPIQNQAIPIGMNGKDVLGIAQTGTGKTLAFGIPLIQRLDRFPGKALVVLPTRELAQQVNEMLAPLARIFNLRTVVLIGGVSMHGQIRDLAHNPRIIIATPGRLLDHAEQRRVRLDQVNFLVLDEADRMLDMGFAPQITRIIKAIPTQRQTMLFSATMPQAIFRLATSCMTLPVHVEVAPSGTTVSDTDQEIFIVRREAKFSLLEKVLQEHTGTVLVFSRTKFGAIRITRVLKDLGHHAAEIHSQRTQGQRCEALSGFKSGKYRILVATDIAARGLDVKNIEVVINFDLPDNSEDYVHRIGRTGRAGKKGLAISFATLDQKHELHCIERLIRKTLVTSTKREAHPDVIETYKFSGEENTRSALIRPKSSVRSFGPRRFGSRRR